MDSNLTLIGNYIKLFRDDTKYLINNTIPDAYLPTPSESDYKVGIIERYFLQQRDSNLSPIFEVSKKEYDKRVTYVYYKGVSLKWRISGDVRDKFTTNQDGTLIKTPSVITSNKLAIKEASKILPNIGLYLVNLTQFHLPNKL
jgi:hypothetical protein